MRPLGVRSVRVVGEASRATGEGWSLVGQDGGQTIPLGDGRALFVFCDTLLSRAGSRRASPGPTGDRRDGVFLANTAAISSTSTSLSKALSSLDYFVDDEELPRQVLNPSIGEHLNGERFWPQHGLAVDGKVLLYYLGIQHSEPGDWSFHASGTGLAVLDPSTGECERTRVADDWRLWPTSRRDLRVGVQALRREDVAYVFMTSRTGTDRWAHLARVPLADIAVLEAYEYLTSPRPMWSADASDCCHLGPCSNEYSVSFNPYLGGYLMTYVNGFDKALYLRASAEIWGPYGEPIEVGHLPHHRDSAFVFLAFEHPDFSRNDGQTLYVTYCQPAFRQNMVVAVHLR